MKSLKIKNNDFIDKFKSIDVSALNASEYVKNYISSYQSQIEIVVQRYQYLLEKIISKKGKDIVFVDYGGGTGLFSLLAKYTGIRKVIYVDISTEMLNGAKSLANLLEVEVDDFVNWHYESEKEFPYDDIDVVSNYDVLEHLYNPVKAFNLLTNLLKPNGMILMASGSNTYHPVVRWLFSKKHKISEFTGTISAKEIDSNEPFFEIRERIIREEFKGLTERKIRLFAKKTRGYRKDDIVKKINNYLNYKTEIKPAALLNTCDPMTGNWDEHLIDYFDFKDRLEDYFEDVQLLNGWYPRAKAKFIKNFDIKDENFIKRIFPYLSYLFVKFGFLFNLMIKISPYPFKMFLAPYYIVMAEKPRRTANNKEDLARIYDEWSVWKDDKNELLDLNLHYTPNQTGRKFLSFLKDKSKTLKILDAGCGNGNIAQRAIKEGFHVEGCDISEVAKQKMEMFYRCSIDNLPMEDSFYDTICSFSVLHHLDNPSQGILELNRVLKKGGYLLVTNHTKYSFFTFYRKYILSKIRKNSHLKYLKFNSLETWTQRFEDAGFSVVDYEGIQYSFTLNLLADISIKFLPEKYNIFATLDKILMAILPKRWVANMSYHSFFILKKNADKMVNM